MPSMTLHGSVFVARLAEVTHAAHDHLQISQKVVSEIVQNGGMTEKQLETLQSLDVATQEVEVIQRILEALSAYLAAEGDHVWALQALVKDITLNHVVDHLEGVEASQSLDDGVTLF